MKMTRIMKRYVTFLIAAAILIPAMAGCGSKTDNTQKPAEQAQLRRKLSRKPEKPGLLMTLWWTIRPLICIQRMI